MNDDGTIPKRELPNHTRYNNYRQNVSLSMTGTTPAVDLTARPAADIRDCARLYVQICNRGSAAAAAGVPGTFYRIDPRKSTLDSICTARTASSLLPGSCETVSCAWPTTPVSTPDIWFRVNDDGAVRGPETQCKDGNDLAFLPGLSCIP